MSNLLRIKNNTTDEFITIKVNKYTVSYSKIWGSNIKNMEGSTRSTLIGILPSIEATTDLLYQQDAKQVGTLLNQGYIIAQYYDSLTGVTVEESYIASDIEIEMIREKGKWYEAISFTLEAINVQGVIS